MTSFIGREREILEIKRLVMHVGANGRSPQQRLITLTGPGGCGKTRLALEVASELLKEYEDGAWLVELAAISNPALVPQTIAASLGVREKQGQTLMDSLIDHLRTKKLLLVLDNCEHLIPACAQVAERFLRACPDLQILTTSRESLGISGESIWQVPPLWMPTAPKLPPLKILKQYEAVSLFVERALACQPEFVLTRQNAAAVAQVCQQLDGMPLAIELAAARVRALSVQEIATRLGDRFALLTGGSRTAPARHQTLQAAMDWSFSLLAEPERILLRRLSVFAGGFTLEAAESVCADDPTSNGGSRTASMEVLDLLTQLVEKSLVVAQPSTQTRYRLLETVREYGAAKLEAARELPTFQSRHRDYYLALAERAEPELRGAQQAAWLEQLEKEHGNLRASLEWSLRSKDTETGLRLAGALVRFWQFRGYLSEARQYLERILSQSSSASASARAKALNGTGIVMLMQGDYGPAKAYLEEALVLLRAQGDQKGIADVLHNLANVAWDQGDYAKVRALCAESLAIRQEIGDTLGIAASLTGLGNIAYALGDYAEAQVLFEKSLAHVKAIGDPLHIAITLHNLGNVAMKQGDYKRARTFHEESLAIKRELGDKLGIGYTLHSLGEAAFQLREYDAASTYFAESLSIRHALGDKRSVALSLEAFAMLAIAQWQPERAAQLTGAAEALRESIGAPLAPAGRADYDHTVAAAREGLGEKAFASVWAEGRTMTLEQAIEYALKAS
jgi:non-specific serine/threonine protein kinase